MSFLPVGLMRSPMTRTRSMGTTLVALHTAGGTWRGTWRTWVWLSASRSSRIYSGVVPQQPPNTCTPI